MKGAAPLLLLQQVVVAATTVQEAAYLEMDKREIATWSFKKPASLICLVIRIVSVQWWPPCQGLA